ncbi:MAG: 6-phosphogluconolactonase [Phycisphaerae bacterium]|nr:6-phosphogluconolactonase [Phycisphaerae bacterium]
MTGKSLQQIADDAQGVADACARYILDALTKTLKARSRATLAISGGSTPRALFSNLAKSGFDWSKVHFFWVDERCVPPTDNESNFKLANETLLTPARIPKNNVHRIHGELLPDEGAARYIEEITDFFSLENRQLPAFDIIHRGIGPDAHTASLFPGEPLIDNRTGIAAAVWVEKLRSHRVTLLPGVLMAAQRTVIEAVGDDKADAVHNVLKGPEDPHKYPCQIAARDSDTAMWFLDNAAASKL